ncbi:metallophosphoesterase, partial [Georgenia sp. 10Sc9-8]|nr:metallophosphoesterase [Georgenia halotolerans]
MSIPSTHHRWPWWHRRTPTTRKTLRAALALLVTGLLALAVGVATASTESSLGPHEADYHMTLDREVTLNLGPLGAIVLDSPLPWPLGVEVVVHEIPSEVLDEGESPLPGLASDLAAYGQLISVPEAAVADAVDGLVADAVGRAVVLWSMMLLAIAAGRLASGGRLRVEVKAALARPGVGVLVGAVALAAVVTPVVPAMRQQEADGQHLRLLHGTPLEEARITGRLAGLIDTYGGVVVGAYRDNEAFYAEVTDNLAAAYEQDAEPVEPSAVPTPSPTPPDPADPAAPGEDGAGAPDGDLPAFTDDGPEDAGAPDEDVTAPDADAPSPAGDTPEVADVPGAAGAAEAGSAPADAGTPSADEVPEPEPVTFLLVSDLHCNVGMADVVGEAARLAEVDAVLDAGDTVMSGTSVESFCVNAFAAAAPDGLPWVVSTGNHDSVLTAEQARAAGWTVL